MKTDIPQARYILRTTLEVYNLNPLVVQRIEDALMLMTRHPKKDKVVRNKQFTPAVKARILQELFYEDTLDDDQRRPDVEIAVAAGLTPAGAARVSEVRNGVR